MVILHSLELLKELSEIEQKIASHKKILEFHQIRIDEELLLRVYQQTVRKKTK